MSTEFQQILIEPQLQKLVDSAPDPVVILDAEKEVYVSANDKALALFKMQREELFGRGVLGLSPSQMFGRRTREIAEEKLQEVLIGGNPVFDWIHLNSAGEEMQTEVRAFRCPPYDRPLVWTTIIDKRAREKTFKGMRISEERLFLALEVTEMGCYDWYPKENALHWDLHMHRLFGLDIDSQHDRNQYFLTVLHSEDRAMVVQQMFKAIDPQNTDNSFDYNYRIFRNGELRYISSRGLLMRNEQNEVVRLVGICRDVTHERIRETLLIDTSQRLQQAQEMAKLGSYEVKYETNEVWWSNELYRLLDIDSSIASPNMDYFIDKIHPDDRALVQQTFSNHHSISHTREIEYRYMTQDGEYKHIRELIFPVLNPENNANIGIRGICQDITEIKSIQAEAEMLEARWKSFAENTFDWLAIIDQKGIIQFINRMQEDIREQDIIGKMSIYDYLDTSEHEEIKKKIKLVFEEKKVQHIEIYSPPLDLWIGNYVAPIIQHGKVVQASILARNLNPEKEVEKKLNSIQRTMQEAQRIARIGSWDLNLISHEIFWSDELFRIYGLNPELGPPPMKTHIAHVHPDDREKVKLACTMAEREGTRFFAEYRAYRYDTGEIIYLRAEGEVLKDSSGKVERLVGSVQDITLQKAHERELQDTLRQLQLSIETAELGVWRFNLKTKKEIWNEELKKSYGLDDPSIDIDKVNWKEFVHPEDIDFVEEQLQIALLGQKLQDIHYRIINTKGELRYLQAYVSPVYNESGEVIELIDISVDVTKLKESERALKARESFLQTILDNNLYGIVITDDEGRYQFVNQAAADMLGYPREKMLQMKVGQIQSASSITTQNQFETYRQKGQDVGEFTFYRPDGQARILMYQAFQVEDAMHVSMLADITEKKQAEEDLLYSEEKFSKTFQYNPTMMILVDLDKRMILDINEAYRKATGFSEEDVLNIPGKLGFLAEKNQMVEENILLLKKNKYLKDLEINLKSKSGEIIHGILFMQLVELKGRELYIASIIDISQRLKTEEKLRESQEKFSKAFHEHPVAMQIMDIKSGIRMEVNKMLCELTGYTQEELIGSSIHDLDLWKNTAKKFESIEELLQNKFVKNLPISIITKSGEIRELLGTACLLNMGDDNLIISSYLDVTEQLVAETQLNEAFEKISQLKNQLQAENMYLREEIKLQNNFEDMVFASSQFKGVLTQVEQVAPLDATVLIQGETGTGKELIARAIHNLSPRKYRPMIKVNCGALPLHLIESELFGFEKGAFTGATHTKVGRFELADQGTLFLDEIGEMPLEVQVKLLRVLQEGEFERLGSTKTTKVNVRIIAATNRDLKKSVELKDFRQDLYFRLSVFPIQVPPLRDRIEDIPILVEHFVDKYTSKHGKKIQYISDEAMDFLHTYNWPGNIRELENLIERAVILSPSISLQIPDINPSPNKQLIRASDLSLQSVLRTHILKVLRKSNWKIDGAEGAAVALGLKPSTLRDRMKKLGIKRPTP